MKLGTTDTNYISYGDKRYQLMHEDGYGFCDFSMADTETVFYTDTREAALAEEKRLADASGIVFSQVHGPWRYPPQDSTEAERAERFEKMCICLDNARLLDCPYMVVHPIMPFGTKSEPDFELFFKMNIEFYKALAVHAEKAGVVICLENMPMHSLDISPPAKTAELIRAIDSEWVKMCLDTGHSIVRNVAPANAVRSYADLICTLHVHDNDGTKDSHLIMTDGIIDWQDFRRALEQTKFDGVFSIEATSHSREDAKRIAEITKKITRG